MFESVDQPTMMRVASSITVARYNQPYPSLQVRVVTNGSGSRHHRSKVTFPVLVQLVVSDVLRPRGRLVDRGICQARAGLKTLGGDPGRPSVRCPRVPWQRPPAGPHAYVRSVSARHRPSTDKTRPW